MTNSVDPDQTVEQSVLGPSCLLLYLIHQQLFAADDFSRRHFQMHFFLGALRVKSFNLIYGKITSTMLKLSFNQIYN